MLKFVHVLVLTIEWSYYVHGTNTIRKLYMFRTVFLISQICYVE